MDLDPAVLAGLTAVLVVIAVTAAIWAALAGRVKSDESYKRRLKAYAPPLGSSRSQGSTEEEVRRQLNMIKARRRRSGLLSYNVVLKQAGLNWPGWAAPLVVMTLVGVLTGVARLMGLSLFVAGIFGLATGPAAFLLFLSVRRKARIKSLEKDFPTALDIIVRGVKTGLPLVDCLRIAGRELPDPLRSEFARMVEQQSHGLSVAEAVDRFAERVPLTEANFFAIVIGLQTKTGGRLSESLENLVSVLRARVQLRAKIRSMSSEAKASGGIIAALPVVVTVLVYITSPQYIGLLFTETIGNLVLIGSAIWMMIGVFVMRAMIQFDY
jgi:tight adherence protein B